MNLDEMKKLYESEPDKWVVYAGNPTEWEKLKEPIFSRFNGKEKLISKKDEAITASAIADPDIEVECINTFVRSDNWRACKDFFNHYNTDHNYMLKAERTRINEDMLKFIDKNKQDFNGGYIKASQEAYDLLIEAGYKDGETESSLIIALQFNSIFLVGENNMVTWSHINSLRDNTIGRKQFYINNGALSWDEPIATEEDIDKCIQELRNKKPSKKYRCIQINNMEDLNELPISGEEKMFKCAKCNMIIDECICDEETISIADKDGKVYEFEKPNFECELKFMAIDGYIYGIVKGYGYHWSSRGKCHVGRSGQHVPNYNLTPIQKKWYETISIVNPAYGFIVDEDYNPSETPIVVTGFEGILEYGINLLYNYNTIEKSHDDVIALESFRLATKQEHDSLYCSEE